MAEAYHDGSSKERLESLLDELESQGRMLKEERRKFATVLQHLPEEQVTVQNPDVAYLLGFFEGKKQLLVDLQVADATAIDLDDEIADLLEGQS